jgi:hypothetical protein
LGQAKDFTAIAVVERVAIEGDWDAAAYARRQTSVLLLRFLERTALGTPYPDVVERVVEVVRSRALAGQCELVVDATGVGRPVVDLLRRARLGCPILPATITGGGRETCAAGYHRVPKSDLIAGLQLLLQTTGLRIAGGLKYAAALTAEMTDMRVKLSGAGKEQFGAWREGTHDDLVLAVALACWAARRRFQAGERSERIL